MNILIMATGGTIGSSFDGTAINVRADKRLEVAERYAAVHRDVRFEIQNPLNILSESLTAQDLNTLAEAISRIDTSAYDGIIVTAGSDNLAYLASFIGLLTGECEVPVMIVATNMVLSDPQANGYENFCCAAELIRQNVSGVFVPYRNADGVMYVHSATDIRQADLSEDFYSYHGAYAVFMNGSLLQQRPYIAQRLPAALDCDPLPVLSDNVLQIHPYPMQDYGRIRTDGARAILHTLYHSATMDSTQMIPFMKEHNDVPMFLASLRRGRKLYQTTVDALSAGAIPLYDISPECAYMKLLFACAQDEMSIKAFMEVNR